MESNIIGGSNVYPCKGKPVCDQEFVDQVEDYEYIKINNQVDKIIEIDYHITSNTNYQNR